MSKFILKEIEINNFRSIKHQNFVLKDGLFVIVGDNKDNPGVTNGAGKTSLISAFFWAITGSSLNGEVLADEVINLKFGNNCRVKCIFEVDGADVIIQRTRKDTEFGNSLYFEINGQDLSCHKLSDTQDRINQYMKIPAELLKSIIIMTSDMKSRFSDLTAQGRIELLETIRDYSLWNRMREESNKDIKDYNNQISDLDTTINTTNGSINTYNQLISELSSQYASVEKQIAEDTTSEQIKNLQQQIQELQDEQNKLVVPTSEIQQYETEIEKQQQSLSDLVNNSKKQELEAIDVDINNQRQSTMDELSTQQSKYSDLQKEQNNLSLQLQQIKSDISLIQKWFTNDTCPTCNRKLDRSAEEIETKTKQLNDNKNQEDQLVKQQTEVGNTLTTLNNQIDELRSKLNTFETLRKEKILKVEESYKEKEAVFTNKIQELKNQINKVRQSVDQIKDRKSEISVLIANNEGKIKVLEAKSEENKHLLEDLKAKDTDYHEKVTQLQSEITTNKENKDKLVAERDVSTYFYQQLGPKGSLRPWLLARDINYLNVCLKRYAHKFFEDVEISLTKPTLEDNTIKIVIDCGKGIIKPVSSLSGGERKRVDLCIQLALYDLVQSTATFSINFVCFDEIESALDGAGIRTLIDLVDDRKEIIPTILWISNRDEVVECIPNKIKVTKLDGISEVKYE